MRTTILSPDLCRAARALIGWSQEDLEQQSKVSKKTIADFERGVSLPYETTLQDLQNALEIGGVVLIPENGGGGGVRRRQAVPRLIRRRISRFDAVASFTMSYRSLEYRVRLSTTILDDIDRATYKSDKEFEEAFDRHLNRILVMAAAALDSGRQAPEGVLNLDPQDFDLR